MDSHLDSVRFMRNCTSGDKHANDRRQYSRCEERAHSPSGELQLGAFDHDRRHLVHRQYEIAHYHALITHFLEGQPAAERKASFQLDPVERDFQIGARQAHARLRRATRCFSASRWASI